MGRRLPSGQSILRRPSWHRAISVQQCGYTDRPVTPSAPREVKRMRSWTRRTVAWILWACALAAYSVLSVAQLDSPIAWGPILGAPGEASIVITWRTTRPVSLDIQYAETADFEETGTWEETLSYEQHEGLGQFALRGLLPGTQYVYELVFYEGDAEYRTTLGTFRTLSSDHDAVSFAVYGATASGPDHHRWVAQTILTETDVDLVFHAGGLVEAPSEERFANFFWAMSSLGQAVPYLTVIGGRDGESELYFDAFALPPGGGHRSKQWWSFDFGPIRFIGLDSTAFARSDPHAVQEQTAWLEKNLQGAAGRIIVVFCADAVYSATYRTERNTQIADLWDPLFRLHGVAVVFSSSVRGYEHIYTQGIHYVNTGGGGSPAGPPPTPIASGTVFRRFGVLHYVVGALSEGTLRIAAIPVASVSGETVVLSATGQPMDTFSVRARR